MTPVLAAPRRTQAQRSDATRARVLDATVALLAEVGHARTTTAAVAARAGVSRGAELHHFPSRADLLVSAVRHLAGQRAAQMRTALDAGGPPDLEAALDVLAGAFTGQLFVASLELWLAARTDDDLRAAVLELERDAGLALRTLCAELFGAVDPATARTAGDLTLDLLRGIGIAVLLYPEADAVRRRTRLLTAWREVLADLIGRARAENVGHATD